jgi:two-component system, OmpR family, sensor histidine kinase KdpD
MVGTVPQRLLRQVPYWLGLPLLITTLGFLPGSLVSQSTLLLLYLCAVLFTALQCGQLTVILGALASFLLFNFFHAEPYFSFYMSHAPELLAAVVFMGFALIAGTIAGKLNRQLEQLQVQKEFFGAQVELHRRQQELQTEAALPALLDELFGSLFGRTLQFSLKPDTANRLVTLHWETAGTLPLDPDHEAMLSSLREQVQSELQRLATTRALQRAERESDEEKLRSALLSSVSHDLKTPLVTMIGAATSLRDLRQDLSSSDAAELLDCIISESQRLEAYIQNLLDMTRLGHGKLALSRDWVSFEEIYHVVARRIARLVATPTLSLQVAGELPSIHVHAALIEQGLFNVIDNAIKAAGADKEIRVDADVHEGMLRIRVCDRGPGLPRSEWQAVFDPFYTFSLGDCYEKGTGLGLSICRSIFRVHGGDAVIIEPEPGYGHCVGLSLPLPAAAEATGSPP